MTTAIATAGAVVAIAIIFAGLLVFCAIHRLAYVLSKRDDGA